MRDTPRTDVKCVNCGYPPSRHSPKDSACPCYDMMESYFHPTYKWKSEGKPTSEMDERDERISNLERELAAKAEDIAKLKGHAEAMAEAIQFGDMAILTVAKAAAESYRSDYPKGPK